MIRDIPALLAQLEKEFKANVDIGVLGISGGADSTLVAILATKFLGKENVFTVSMPYCDFDHKTFNARSAKLAAMLGVNHTTVPVDQISDCIIGGVLEAMHDLVGSESLNQVNEGNARSRARMTLLYGVAWELGERFQQRARVLGTGNLSEDFIGYDTKGGDSLCDWFLIGSLFKSEVYQLLEYFRDKGVITEDMIDRKPSAGLWEGQTDEEELGYSYDAMEPIIKEMLTWQERGDLNIYPVQFDIEAFVLNRHFSNKHKHQGPPASELREHCS